MDEMQGQGGLAVAPARRRGLADEVADRIREAIFSGAYAPGAPLREVELSGVLQVGRGPVREALRVLEREGLVHCGWHRGSVVTTLSAEDVAELDSLRGALEDLAVQQVIAHASTRTWPPSRRRPVGWTARRTRTPWSVWTWLSTSCLPACRCRCS
jgi:DNA-binding GntR family transcriptional regulator